MSTELIHLLSLDIPESLKVEDGFLEIADIAHHENVNSRIYAYFLRKENNKELAEVFLQSLLAVIEKKRKEIKSGSTISLEEYSCETEEATQKGFRIDIALHDKNAKSAVVIENKIHHHLDNDLLDYWKHFNYPDENKTGVLLTLEKHDIPVNVMEFFVNITHIEWVDEIRRRGLPTGLPIKYYTYLNDFFQTITNLSITNIMNEQALFYFQHTSTILKATETKDEAYKFIDGQLRELAGKLGLSAKGTSKEYRELRDLEKTPDTFYTIIIESLLNEKPSIRIMIELQGKDMDKYNDIVSLVEKESLNKISTTGLRTNSAFKHVAEKEYRDLKIEQIQDFANVVDRFIREDFKPLMDKILAHNYPMKKS